MPNRGDNNMATTPIFQIVKPPERFSIGDDATKFSKELANYFLMLQTPTEEQNLLLPAFLSTELVERYRRTAALIPNDWQAAFRKAFQKPMTLQMKIQEAFSLDGSQFSIEDLVEKAEELTDDILKFNLDRASIFRSILMSALKDPELKKEVITKPNADVPTIKNNLIAVDEIRQQIQPEQFTYAQAVENRARKPIPAARRPIPAPTSKPVRCFKCDKEGHISRNCRESSANVRVRFDRRFDRRLDQRLDQRLDRNDPPRCFACKEIGHIRRDCPNIKCNHCKRNGHFSHQCYLRHDNGTRRANVLNEEAENDNHLDLLQNGLNEDAPLFGEIVGADQSR